MEKKKTLEQQLDDIGRRIYQLENAQLYGMPQQPPYQKTRLFAIGAGQLVNNRTLTIGPGGCVEILRWEYAPVHFFMSVLGVSFPDATLPYVGLVVNLDRMLDVADWTIEEYQNVLGLNATKTPMYQYGGCTLYNAATFNYVALTNWDYMSDDYLQVKIANYTNTPATLDVLDLQFWSSADISHIKQFYWGIKSLQA